MKYSKQTFLYFTRIIKMSDKKSTNKDVFMFMKNFGHKSPRSQQEFWTKTNPSAQFQIF